MKLETRIKLTFFVIFAFFVLMTVLIAKALNKADEGCMLRGGNPVIFFCFDKNLTKGILK